jgi:phospholipid/cholesterol/gamma-HCH transport system substrate-binding protein
MDSKVNYALIGLLVIILSILLVAVILWLSVGTEQKVHDTYQAYIQESVSGLNRKAPVKYRGVEVGYVRDISLIPDRPNEVRVLLDIEHNVPIKQDTLVLLSTQGLTGLAYIELTGGSIKSSPPLRQPGQPYPEIKTKPSLLVRLDTTISTLLTHLEKVSEIANSFFTEVNFDRDLTGKLLNNFSHLSRAVNELLSEKNLVAVTNTLHYVENVTGTMANHTDNISSSLVNLEQTTSNANKMSLQLSNLLAQLETSLVTLSTTANSFNNTAKMINQMVESNRQDVEETTQAVAKTATNITKAVEESREDMNYFTRQALPEVTTLLRELHILLNTLRSFTQELEHKPNMLLFGKSKPAPGPGE